LAGGYEFRGWMLLANAAQVLRVPLTDLYSQLANSDGDVRLLSDSAGRVGSVMLVSCAVFRTVPVLGYCDFKEQVLPALQEAGCKVGISSSILRSSISLRDRQGYLEAVATELDTDGLGTRAIEASEEGWRSRFSMVEAGAAVHPTAVVHNSVVLAGARIGAG